MSKVQVFERFEHVTAVIGEIDASFEGHLGKLDIFGCYLQP